MAYARDRRVAARERKKDLRRRPGRSDSGRKRSITKRDLEEAVRKALAAEAEKRQGRSITQAALDEAVAHARRDEAQKHAAALTRVRVSLYYYSSY